MPWDKTLMDRADCFICHKHQDFSKYCGTPIMQLGGLVLSHFPLLADEKATRGHLIIEPIRHIEELSDMNSEEAANLGGIIRAGATAIKQVLGAEHVYFFRINDRVKHLHFHLVPRYPGTPKAFFGTEIMKYPNRDLIGLDQIVATSNAMRVAMFRSRGACEVTHL